MVFEKPCGVVIGVRELFGSESKSQVYGHLHDLIDKEKMDDLGNFAMLSILVKIIDLPHAQQNFLIQNLILFSRNNLL